MTKHEQRKEFFAKIRVENNDMQISNREKVYKKLIEHKYGNSIKTGDLEEDGREER